MRGTLSDKSLQATRDGACSLRSQRRHQMVAPNELFAARNVVAVVVHVIWSRVPELWTLGIMKPTTTILLAFVVFLSMSCESPERAVRRRAQWEQNIEQARIRVLDQLPDLDSASREMIRTNRPSIPYVGAPFGGNYWFRWPISSNRVAVLDAGGTPGNVSGRPVTIEKLVSERYY